MGVEGKIKNVRFCQVLSIDDDAQADRIKVRLMPEDNDKSSIEDLDYAFPLLPKMLSIKPKVGEAVLILLATNNDGNSQRYYVGPVISQPHHMFFDPYFQGADSYMRGASKKMDARPDSIPEAMGAFKKDDDISIIGRKNCDIQITYDDIRIKAGVKLMNGNNPYKVTFNRSNPSYIKLKYHEKALGGDNKSTATVVADKINLLSNKSYNRQDNGAPFVLTDKDDLITDKELEDVINEAYKLPYGEKLVAFLQKFVNAFVSHTHDFVDLPPNAAFTTPLLQESAEQLGQKKMLSDTVRIN